MSKKIIGRACKHAFQTFHKYNKDDDLITAKITNYYDDGSEEDMLYLKENFKRPFYIVLPKYQNFKDKKDYIEINKVKKYESNQARLGLNISKVLFGRPDRNVDLGMLFNNQFIFGCNEAPAVVFKQLFYDKFPEQQNKAYYRVAAYDVEAYVTEDGVGDTNMASITCEKDVVWVGLRSFFREDKDDATILRKLKEAEKEYLDQDYLKKYNINIKYILADTPGELTAKIIQHWHEIKPDYVVSWNANFDMEQNEKMLLEEGYNPASIYSDPKIPEVYKGYVYYKGREFKRKVDGSTSPLDPQERFPVLRAPASWQWFDGMSFYAISRTAKGKKDSYALQYTAEQEGIKGKLYTKEGQHLINGSVDWHKYMQDKFPYIYAMYNIQDNFVIEDLNRATNDYSLALPSLITSSELPSYQSQPTLISDELSFIALKHGYVWGTVGRARDEEFKKLRPDLKDWIALLHTELNENNGIPLYAGLPKIKSRGHGATDDIDVTAAYPHAQITLNVSNKTTKIEVCNIDGLNRIEFRRLGVNYASSPTANATTLAKTIYNMPSLIEIGDLYDNEILPFIVAREEHEKEKELV